MLIFLQKILQVIAGLLLLAMAGCYESPTDPVSQKEMEEQPGFTGTLSGAVEKSISGPGIVTYLPSQNTIDGERSGYFLVANDRGAADPLITFRVPDGTESGTYNLVGIDPMELGEHFEVRLETRVDDTLTSFGYQTEGTLNLDKFPSDGKDLTGSKIKGSFQFVTQSAEGKALSGKGEFEFLGSGKLITLSLQEWMRGKER